MSNLLKSKFFLGVMIVAVMAVGFVAFGANTASADCSITTTLRVGSRGAEVMCLQSIVGATADGAFGPMTKTAVMAWQAGHGLTADGVVGPMTRAALMAQGSMSGNFPAGCTSAAGYSSTTGVACNSGPSAGLPAGCSSTAGYSVTTGKKCDGGTTSNGPLTGGAGTLDITSSSANIEGTVKEGDTEKVAAFKAEADGSDIEVTNLKVVLHNKTGATSSEKLSNYIDTVSVWMGSTKVGEADAGDFSRDAGDSDTYTESIALSDAVVKDGVKATFYIAVEANSSIDSTDMSDAVWTVVGDTLRYTDSTGAILSDDANTSETFDFEDGSADDDISIKSSSANPVASTFQVEEDSSSDQFLVGAFKLDVDDQSGDVDVTSLSITLAIDDTDNTGTDPEEVVDSVIVKIDGTEYEADLDSDNLASGDGDAVYLVEFDAGEVTIDSGDEAEVKVYATFNDQSGNYGAGTTIQASITGSTDIDAETSSDDVAVTGSFTGKTHTLTVNAPTFSLVSKSLSLYQAIDGVATGEEDVFLAKFVFNVTAADDDVYLSKGIEGDESTYGTVDNSGDTLKYTRIGAGTINSYTIVADDDSLDDGLTSSYLISAGSTEKFTVSFYVRGNNTTEDFTIDSFAYGSADDASGVFDYDSVVSSGLTAFSTDTTYLAK